MADIEVTFVGRLSSHGDMEPDVILFATQDNTRMFPVWVEGARDLAGRPTDASVLATVIASDDAADPWFAELSTISKGQITATLVQGGRRIDVRPSALEALWHAGVLFDVKVKEYMASWLIDVNPQWLLQLREKLAQQATSTIAGEPVDDAELPGRVYLQWDSGHWELDGVGPDPAVGIDVLGDTDFDDELRRLLGGES